MDKVKPFAISKGAVWEAFKRVKVETRNAPLRLRLGNSKNIENPT